MAIPPIHAQIVDNIGYKIFHPYKIKIISDMDSFTKSNGKSFWGETTVNNYLTPYTGIITDKISFMHWVFLFPS